jgi:aminopeptidase N
MRCVVAVLVLTGALPLVAQHTMPPATATPRVAPPPLGRLAPASSVDLRHVSLSLRLDWTTRTAQGAAELSLSPTRAVDVVELDACQLVVDRATDGNGTPLTFTTSGDGADGRLHVRLPRRAEKGDSLAITVHYRTAWVNHADPMALGGSTGRGLRFFRPTGTERAKRRQLWAMGEPDGGRCWFPTNDSPDDAFTSELTVTAPTGLTVVGTGQRDGSTVAADGMSTHRWRSTVAHPTHHLSLVVGDWIDVRRDVDGIPLHSLGYADERAAVDASIERLPLMVAYQARLLGIPFPHQQYTQVFVQDVPWGTTVPGLSLMTENMIDDFRTHADYRYLWDGLEGEGVAAQWTQLTRLRDWRHAWLHRGLARHLDGLFTEASLGRDEMLLWNYGVGDVSTSTFDWQSGVRHPIVPATLDSAAAYAMGNMPYFRAAQVLHHLRSVVGDSVWLRGVRRYLREHRGDVVTTFDFQRAIEREHGAPLDWFFEQWFHRSGLPVFDVRTSYDAVNRRVVVSVAQVQRMDSTIAHPQVHRFQGPVAIAVDSAVHRVWLNAQDSMQYSFAVSSAPRFISFDHGSVWLKELRYAPPVAALVAQSQHDRDPLGRLWALRALGARATADSVSATDRDAARHGVLTAIRDDASWRLRYSALLTLQRIVAPATPTTRAAIDSATRATLMHVIRTERGWVRSVAFTILGLTRDPSLASLYVAAFSDSSHPVNYAAAIALGQSGSPRAFEALARYGRVASWKGENILCALAGFSELGDARAIPFAVAAFADSTTSRWYLATPRWDYRLAAASTLQKLGAADRVWPIVERRLAAARADDDMNDIFSTALVAATLGHPKATALFASLRTKFGTLPNAAAALDGYEQQWKALQPTGKP